MTIVSLDQETVAIASKLDKPPSGIDDSPLHVELEFLQNDLFIPSDAFFTILKEMWSHIGMLKVRQKDIPIFSSALLYGEGRVENGNYYITNVANAKILPKRYLTRKPFSRSEFLHVALLLENQLGDLYNETIPTRSFRRALREFGKDHGLRIDVYPTLYKPNLADAIEDALNEIISAPQEKRKLIPSQVNLCPYTDFSIMDAWNKLGVMGRDLRYKWEKDSDYLFLKFRTKSTFDGFSPIFTGSDIIHSGREASLIKGDCANFNNGYIVGASNIERKTIRRYYNSNPLKTAQRHFKDIVEKGQIGPEYGFAILFYVVDYKIIPVPLEKQPSYYEIDVLKVPNRMNII